MAREVAADGRRIFPASMSLATIGFYIFLMLILLLTVTTNLVANAYVIYFLIAVFLAFLLRYLSTAYWMDSDSVGAWRLVGTRTIRLEDIRDIEFANLRDLGPTGFTGSWGYRGRMWSPRIGRFDSIHTVSPGVLITADPVPLFVSPKDPVGFARELSRRVRSYHEVDLSVDAPVSAPSAVPAY